jgi:hypothetical protein
MVLVVKMAPSTPYEQMQVTRERMRELGFRLVTQNKNPSMSDEIYLFPDDSSLRIVIKHEPNNSTLSFEQHNGQGWTEIGKISRAGFASYEPLPPAFLSVRPEIQHNELPIFSHDA